MNALITIVEGIAYIGSWPGTLLLTGVLAVWTLLAVLLRLGLAALPDRYTLQHYHLRMGMLYSLPVMIATAMMIRFAAPSAKVSVPLSVDMSQLIVTASSPTAGGASVETQATLMHLLSQPAFFVGALLCLMLVGVLIGGMRMAFQVNTLRQLLRWPGSRVQDDESPVGYIRRKLGIPDMIGVYRHPRVEVPLTIGRRNAIIVLPDRQFESRELELILHHEWVHIRRGHFLLKTAEEAIRSLLFTHPLVHQLAGEITVWREMTCDSELLSDGGISRREYALLLYHALPQNGWTAHPLLSASMSVRKDLARRIKAMEDYPQEPGMWRLRHSASISLAAVVTGLMLLPAACDFGIPPRLLVDQEGLQSDTEIHSAVEEMPEPVNGLGAIYENLRYPEEAREQGIEDRIVVRFIVGADGSLSGFERERGEEILYEAAVEAIRLTEWRPGRENGREVPVDFMLPIMFRL